MMVTATVPPPPDSRPATVPRAPQGSDFSQRKIRDEATQSDVLPVKFGVLPVKNQGVRPLRPQRAGVEPTPFRGLRPPCQRRTRG